VPIKCLCYLPVPQGNSGERWLPTSVIPQSVEAAGVLRMSTLYYGFPWVVKSPQAVFSNGFECRLATHALPGMVRIGLSPHPGCYLCPRIPSMMYDLPIWQIILF
jgi:hypothetical protein